MYINYSLWDKLRETEKPVFLYGTGNGADKIITALDKYNVKLNGIFASDSFVRDRYFHGFHVRAYADVAAEYGDDIAVLLAFGTTLPEVRAFIEQLDRRHDLYIPDVPLYGGELFDMSYFISHKAELDCARELLYDEKSRGLFDDAVNFRLSGKYEYLLNTEQVEKTLSELFAGKKITTIVDGGAFRGDSSEIFTDILSPDVIYSIEADPKTYIKLQKYAESEARCKIFPINAALSDFDGEVLYSSSGSRGAGEEGKNRRAKTSTTQCIKLDTALSEQDVDFIKLDIEGSEEAALRGGEALIKRCKPDMAVSLYHRTDDLFGLIFKLHELLPEHKLYLRRIDCIPMWDLTVYAVK